MTYIVPNGTIKLLANVPIDSDYHHTVRFHNATDQYNWMVTHTVKTFLNNTYTRTQRGIFRAEILPSEQAEVYGCNYMMFQNTSFLNKWFYAFVDSVEYVNNNMFEIHFTIDVFQTYFFQGGSIGECFVNREHVADDYIGSHIEAEPVTIGEYVFRSGTYNKLTDILDKRCYVLAIVDVNGSSSSNVYNGIACGATLYAYDNVTLLNNKINEYIQQTDAIQGLYMAPTWFMPGHVCPNGLIEGSTSAIADVVDFGSVTTTAMDFNGYKPKNKKLYTYPYMYLEVNNSGGQTMTLRYEFFTDAYGNMIQPRFKIAGSILMPVQVALWPVGYAYSDNDSGNNTNTVRCLNLPDYPLCSWNYDAYKAWVAQNSRNIGVENAATAIKAIVHGGAGVLQLLGAPFLQHSVSEGVNKIGSAIGSVFDRAVENNMADYTASIQADSLNGNIASGNILISCDQQTFWAGRKCITAQQAKVIDDFFTEFGYNVGRVKVPEIWSRPHFNYVKTTGANIHGNMPMDAQNEIMSVFDRGITFWDKDSTVGDYSVDNANIHYSV